MADSLEAARLVHRARVYLGELPADAPEPGEG
jgi:hypothetical protein